MKPKRILTWAKETDDMGRERWTIIEEETNYDDTTSHFAGAVADAVNRLKRSYQ